MSQTPRPISQAALDLVDRAEPFATGHEYQQALAEARKRYGQNQETNDQGFMLRVNATSLKNPSILNTPW